tara:strand:- start:549 stop:1133 length:585 start_codon:yes stop_codon:yes gene_type:complete
MVKLIGKNKIKCAVFISGRGSNLKSILKFSKKKSSKFNIKLVVSNKKFAPGISIAKKNKVNFKIVNYKSIKEAERQILNCLNKNNIEFIILAGFMKILSKYFIKKFRNKIINIHPSLLPKYKGLNTHEKTIRNREKFSGCTIHLVNEKLDSGKIIMQKKVKILNLDTPDSLAKRILKEENRIYPKVINKVLSRI